jgi:hypothetical protein
MLFEKEGRPKARKILVVFSDGKLPTNVEDIKRFKKPLEKKNIKVISVTVGDNVEEDKFNELSSKNETTRHDDEQEPKDTADKNPGRNFERFALYLLVIRHIYIFNNLFTHFSRKTATSITGFCIKPFPILLHSNLLRDV